MFDLRAFAEKLDSLCRSLPEVEAYTMNFEPPHPAYRAGKKPFLIVGTEPADPTLSVKMPLHDQPIYLDDPRIERTAYIGQHGWVTLQLDRGFAWEEVERMVTLSYRCVALKRMLKALDARN
jgi:predicted DNA-binding protein (MmcQ/YjbR family)